MQTIRACVTAHTSAWSRCLERKPSAHGILVILARLACIYLDGVQPPAAAGPIDEELVRLDAQLIQAISDGQGQCIQNAFWELDNFTTFANAVLSAVTTDVLETWTTEEGESGLYRIFREAPAWIVLSVLAQYLASTQPVVSGRRGTMLAAAEGADTAAKLLIGRFLAPGSRGVEELAGAWGAENSARAGGDVDRKMQDTARVLVSLPERAACVWIPELDSARYVPRLVDRLLAVADSGDTGQETAGAGPRAETAGPLEAGEGTGRGGVASTSEAEHSQEGGSEGRPGDLKQAAQAAGARKFLGLVISKLGRRGHAIQVTDSIWRRVRWRGEHTTTQRQDLRPNVLAMAVEAVTDVAAAEKVVEALVKQAAANGITEDVAVNALKGLLAPGGFVDRWGATAARYFLVEKLLLHGTLPPLGLSLIIHLISCLQAESVLEASVPTTMLALAEGWGSKETIDRLAAPRQAYLTAALILCLQRTTKAQLEATPGLLIALLQGVGARLDNPIPCTRLQGMRVGSRLARLLDAEKPLFDDMGPLDIVQEEWWHPDCAATKFGIPPLLGSGACGALPDGGASHQAVDAAGSVTHTGALPSSGGRRSVAGFSVATPQNGVANKELLDLEGGDLPGQQEDANSPGDTATDSDDESLVAYDLRESDDEDVGVEGDRPLQLREVAEMIRKADDSQAVVKGLSLLPALIEAAPDELANYSSELARSLLHCHPPDWADTEAESEEDKASFHRLRALTSLLVEVPREAGLALASEVYSPHLDLHQRLVVLDTLSAAALQMSTPPSRAKTALTMEGASGGGAGQAVVAETRGKERRWGLTSMALRNAQKPKTFRNRFPEVAVEWASALLEDCSRERHGVDLFGRDNLLLGRLLTTLGVFVQAAAPSLPTSQIAATTLEMLRTPHVHNHPQPYVRRSALVAASAILASLPPARVAGAMTGGRGDLQDSLLVERLEWLQGWLAATTAADPDSQVRYLAAGCQALQSELAANALEHLENEDPLQNSLMSKGPSELLGIRGEQRPPNYSIKLPQALNLT